MRAEENAEKLRAFWEAWTPGGEMDMSILDPDVIYEDSNLPDHIGEEYTSGSGDLPVSERPQIGERPLFLDAGTPTRRSLSSRDRGCSRPGGGRRPRSART
jgi:hypothetical protein